MIGRLGTVSTVNAGQHRPQSAAPIPTKNLNNPIRIRALGTRQRILHNHPSGDPTPSPADVDMTRQVADAGRALRIAVHDHLIAGRDGVASLKALGLF